MKILSAQQIREVEAYTIQTKGLELGKLMEKAADKFVEELKLTLFNDIIGDAFTNFVYIFCGKGNNGGDGLAIARKLIKQKAFEDCEIFVFILNTSPNASEEFSLNYKRLIEIDNEQLHIRFFNNTEVNQIIEDIGIDDIVIDAIFGTGLNRPITGFIADIITAINARKCKFKYAVDIPSGLYADKPITKNDVVFKATKTITFNAPKLQFMFADNAEYIGDFYIKDIDLLIPRKRFELPITFVTECSLPLRKPFSHKGTFGHALLVAGSYGKMGAATLATKACLTTGCGLITTHIPQCGYTILQISVPEAMASIDTNEEFISEFPDTDKYTAIGIGPGLGTNKRTINAFAEFLRTNTKPLVIDADALNILALQEDLWQCIPQNTIITPHPGEFDRLTHKHSNCYERYCTQIQFAKEHNCIVVLKGHNTSICTPDGQIFFNSTGNPYMATGGSGDTLTGIILSLLTQGFSPLFSAVTGVFLHGKAGDNTLECSGISTITASNLIASIPGVIDELSHNTTDFEK